MTTLAIRNCNPGNIRPSNPSWQGAIGENKGFVIFDTMENGVRALGKQLLAYYDRHKAADGSRIDTVREAIERWAPPSENDTEGYVAFVCTVLEVRPDDELDFHDPDTLYWMTVAIGEQESGHKAFTEGVSEADLNAGVAAALA